MLRTTAVQSELTFVVAEWCTIKCVTVVYCGVQPESWPSGQPHAVLVTSAGRAIEVIISDPKKNEIDDASAPFPASQPDSCALANGTPQQSGEIQTHMVQSNFIAQSIFKRLYQN